MNKSTIIEVLELLFTIEENGNDLVLFDNAYGDQFAVLYFDENNIYTGYDMQTERNGSYESKRIN